VRDTNLPARSASVGPSASPADEALARLAEAFARTVGGLRVEEDCAPVMNAAGAFLARLHHRTRTITLNGTFLAADDRPERTRRYLIAHEWLHAVRAGLVGDEAARRDAAVIVGAAGGDEAAADWVGDHVAACGHRESAHDL